jgi:hypothetical protein
MTGDDGAPRGAQPHADANRLVQNTVVRSGVGDSKTPLRVPEWANDLQTREDLQSPRTAGNLQ